MLIASYLWDLMIHELKSLDITSQFKGYEILVQTKNLIICDSFTIKSRYS